jgi:hypothetical protein
LYSALHRLCKVPAEAKQMLVTNNLSETDALQVFAQTSSTWSVDLSRNLALHLGSKWKSANIKNYVKILFSLAGNTFVDKIIFL